MVNNSHIIEMLKAHIEEEVEIERDTIARNFSDRCIHKDFDEQKELLQLKLKNLSIPMAVDFFHRIIQKFEEGEFSHGRSR